MEQNTISISYMNINDLEQIRDILKSDFDDFWNYSIFENELKSPNSVYFVAKESNQIVGFVGVTIVLDEADITNIVVRKNCRGKRYI